MEEERARLERLSAVEREVHAARAAIVDGILTLKCPRAGCGQAFADFEGCFALTCGRCRCGFCAWCLEDCGNDAHAHVAQCPEGAQNGYYGTFAQFEEHHVQRRRRQVEAFLGTLGEGIQAQVVDLCKKDLADMGMRDIADRIAGHQAAGLDDAVAHMDLDEAVAIQLQLEEEEEEGKGRYDY